MNREAGRARLQYTKTPVRVQAVTALAWVALGVVGTLVGVFVLAVWL